MPEGECAQERPQRRRGHDPVAEHLRGLAGAQHVGVVDAVAAGRHRMQQGQDLPPGSVRARALAEVHQLIHDRLDPQLLGERGRQQQPGVGDRVVVVKGNHHGVGTVRRWHRESALLVGDR
jgi:hypothetical protein